MLWRRQLPPGKIDRKPEKERLTFQNPRDTLAKYFSAQTAAVCGKTPQKAEPGTTIRKATPRIAAESPYTRDF